MKPRIAEYCEGNAADNVNEVVLFGGEGRDRDQDRPNEEYPKQFYLFVGNESKGRQKYGRHVQARQAVGGRIRFAQPTPCSLEPCG